MPYGYIRERLPDPPISAKPNITSFADVTLVLLVIFLVSASVSRAMVELDPPDADHTAAKDINLAVTLSIARPQAAAEQGWQFYFEDDTTGIEAKNLWTALSQIAAGDRWSMALIRADKATPCKYVALLIQCLQGLGVDEISFLMRSEQEQNPRPAGPGD